MLETQPTPQDVKRILAEYPPTSILMAAYQVFMGAMTEPTHMIVLSDPSDAQAKKIVIVPPQAFLQLRLDHDKQLEAAGKPQT